MCVPTRFVPRGTQALKIEMQIIKNKIIDSANSVHVIYVHCSYNLMPGTWDTRMYQTSYRERNNDRLFASPKPSTNSITE